jgi:integrase
MALNLYRRHRKECEGSHSEDSRTGQFEEGRRGWKKCACAIHVSGTLGGKFSRRRTGTADWDEAKALVALLQQSGSWDGQDNIEAPLPLPAANPEPDRISIGRAIAAFTTEFEEYTALGTQRYYKLLLKQLRAFSEARGYSAIDQWTPLDVRDFRASWGVLPSTSARNMSVVKVFFEYCRLNEWMHRNPASMVRNRRGQRTDPRSEQKLPFSDEELRRMYEACDTKYGKREIQWAKATKERRTQGRYAQFKTKWTGQDIADFISVSVYTGLRISDVCTFHIERMRPDGTIQLRTTKAHTHVYTWVPEWLQERIRTRALETGPYIFGEHSTTDLNVITDLWRRKLIKLWKLCGPWKDKPTPHRFRHTFARILLERPGVTVRDVAELLGNTEQIVRKHYAAWIPERQERLTAVLKAAFETKPKPKPNVIAMPKPAKG